MKSFPEKKSLSWISSCCLWGSELKFIKLHYLLFLCLFFIGIKGEHAFASEVNSILNSERLSRVLSIDLPEVGEISASRIFSKDLGEGDFSWNGRVLGPRNGYLTFSYVKGRISGSLTRIGEPSYRFTGSTAGLNFEKVKVGGQCGGCIVDNNLPPDPRYNAVPAKSWRNGEAQLIDLLIVDPAAVRSEAGSTADVEAAIASAVADSNLCYRKSLVPLQLRVVHMAEVSYTPTGTLNIDLDRLKAKSDGYMDSVHTLRDQYGADLVCLLTTDSDYGGLASTMTRPSLNFESSGFNVNVWDQLGAPSYTLAHEIGHNMGCLHNREDATWTSEYDYGEFCFGKRWLVGAEGYRTVMSYNNASQYNNRIPHFSNPSVSFEGVATGNVGTENNAKVLALSAPYTANFRSAVVQGIVTSIFDLSLTEEATGSIKVRLATEPASSVTVNASISGDANLILGGSASLTFDSSNWNIFQTVTVTAVVDNNTANGTATVTFSSTGINSAQVQVTENDTGVHSTAGYMFGGVVSNELGMGIPGVTLTFSDGSGALTTDENGSFYRELSNGWNGTITPSKDGYSFSPSNIAISSHAAHSVSHVLVGSRDSVLYVDCDATGTGDGSTWANAYTDLSEALSSERVFTEVWVAAGTYLPGEIRSSFFLLPPNIAVYGGFAGTETSRDQRDTVTNLTILSGDIGILNDNSDNCFHVVVPSNGSSLDGFRIMGGYANKNYSDDDRGKGAGLWADEVNFSVNDCNFTNNSTYQGGSGVYLYDSNATFENCVFTQNSTLSTGSGGAAYFQDSNISITNSIFKSNSAYYWGGAIRSENSTLSISGSQFLENQSLSSNGAGAVMINDGNFSINFTSFTSNQATHDGGALLIVSAGGSIIDSNFTSNLNSQWNGGGALKLESSSPTIQNCIFSYNRTQANHYGGAINLESSSPTIENCTFTRNKSESNSAGALYIDSSSDPVLRNNNFYFNYASSWGGAIFAVNPSFSVEGGVFHGNWANLGGGVATNGSVQSMFNNIRILGNEAN